MTLLQRIDIALTEVGKSRHTLANEIGIARQAIYRLSRRPGSSLKLEHVAKASRALGCDLYWLCTGEGGHYVPAPRDTAFSFLAAEVAKLLDTMGTADREKAFVVIYRMSQGQWPTGFTVDARITPAELSTPLPPPTPRNPRAPHSASAKRTRKRS